MKNIIILCALEKEAKKFCEELNNSTIKHHGKFKIYSGSLANYNVVVMITGVGKVSAAINCQYLIDMFKPDCVLNIGTGGGLCENLNVGDVVLSRYCIQHDMVTTGFTNKGIGYLESIGLTELYADVDLLQKFYDYLKKNTNVYTGAVLTGDQFINDKLKKEWLIKKFPEALIVDMEGGAIAQTCIQNNIPYLCIKTASDMANENSTNSYFKNAVSSSKNLAQLIIDALNSKII